MNPTHFGLAAADPRATLFKVRELLEKIEGIRYIKDKEQMETFRQRYTQEPRYRLWNLGLKHWLKPYNQEELTDEVVDDLLCRVVGLFNIWNDFTGGEIYEDLQHVLTLAEFVNEQTVDHTLFLNEHHIAALNWEPEEE